MQTRLFDRDLPPAAWSGQELITTAGPHRGRRWLRARPPGWIERAGTLVALGVVAVHVVDDSFLQPEPGVAPSDHVVSGFVPLALLGLAALGFVRFRPGARATGVVLAGFFGLLIGSEAAYYSLHGGPSGDDFTGLAAIIAGWVLLAVGGVTLWRSRRTNQRRWRRYLRRLVLTAGACVVAVVVLFPMSIAYVVTHVARAQVPEPRLGATYENVTFTTSDGLRLRGWFVPSRNGATVVVVPGRSAVQRQARMLVGRGYGVLLFDRRGEGESDGDPNVFGWGGDRDLLAAAAYLRSRPDVDSGRLGAIGLSVGGEMLLHAAAHTHAFKAIVSEGASGQSLRDELANPGLSNRLVDLPAQVSVTAALAVFGDALPPLPLERVVAKIWPTEVFFIYGEHGQGGTEVAPNRAFYAAARGQNRIWEVPGGQHIAGITTQPEEYEDRVIGFFHDTLLGSR